MRLSVIGLLICVLLGWGRPVWADESVRKAVGFLSVEVPGWSREHHCFSCHNNGDAARALYRAKAVLPGTLAETTHWLTRPEAWDGQGDEGPSSDKRLARLQFALALATAIDSGVIDARPALRVAVDRVADDLGSDGSWTVDNGMTVGSPVTYGSRLSTALAIRVLRSEGADRHAKRVERAEGWLRARTVENVVEAASVLMIEPRGREPSTETGRRALALLLKAESRRGGWGPYVDVPTEPFDTALALIAMSPFRAEVRVAAAISRGRAALVLMQRPDGSFPTTTRPPGAESYAQSLSTAGWATIALIETER